MRAVVDNGHEMGHVSSIVNIVYLRIYGSMLVIDCAYAFFTNVQMLAGLAHLDCDGSHDVCVLFNFAKSGRMAESENWSPQQPPQEHTGHGLTQARLTSMTNTKSTGRREVGALDGDLDIHHNEKRIKGHIAAYMKIRQRSDIAPVVHRNGLTNNVLLDNNMVLWLSGFWSAKMLN
ncbi:hypothetical protein Tco_1174098 [Tanacetum coccineum]